MHKRFNIRLIPEDDGRWTAEVPALPGCATWGSTREQAFERIKEAIELYLRRQLSKAAGSEMRLRPEAYISIWAEFILTRA
jgi:predicted RNase H-like HicB family nuclease